MLRKAIEFFIPASDINDNEYQRRIRLIAYTLFITAVFSLFYVAISMMSHFVVGEIIMLIGFVIFVVLLFLLKAGLNICVTANIFGFAGIVCIAGSVYFSGGLQSPVLPWLATTPIIILLLAGKKSGSFWAATAVAIVIVFGMMSFEGYVFPSSFLSQDIPFSVSCYSGLILIIFSISIVFENVRERAFNAESLQKKELQKAIVELKSTQAQLIQSEKMASLGELTAGIAHEIQNPLNFINNFSEVNTDLIGELTEQLNTGNNEEVASIAKDIRDNEQKINQHGKRADAIVKGMLQHSRASAGQKEPTNINALADEYLRLSYHGLRSRDKEFNATMRTDFDPGIGEIEIVRQEIGRVLLNLYNNAFYAVNEKKVRQPAGYEPMVFVSTRKENNKVLISIKDNGNGIPQKILNKIFLPFFTTKPPGQGTGLGLSLSFDIIKALGGDIKVVTKEGEGAEFIIHLPVNG